MRWGMRELVWWSPEWEEEPLCRQSLTDAAHRERTGVPEEEEGVMGACVREKEPQGVTCKKSRVYVCRWSFSRGLSARSRGLHENGRVDLLRKELSRGVDVKLVLVFLIK